MNTRPASVPLMITYEFNVKYYIFCATFVPRDAIVFRTLNGHRESAKSMKKGGSYRSVAVMVFIGVAIAVLYFDVFFVGESTFARSGR